LLVGAMVQPVDGLLGIIPNTEARKTMGLLLEMKK
jgi:hypothetical protein